MSLKIGEFILILPILRDLKLEQFFQAHCMKVFLVQADILREKNLCI